MDFAFTEEQLAIRDAVAKICAGFPADYWLKLDREGGFPHDFHAAFAEAGWLGIAMPVEHGGAGLGIAMGNARPEVLAAADRVVASHDDDGLVEVVDLLLAGG